MKIAYATIFDTQDIRRGSGTFYHMSQEIERQGHQVFYPGPIQFQYPSISRALRRLHQTMGKRYLTFLDPFVARNTGKQVTQKLVHENYDVLITNDFAIAAFTENSRPIVLYTDAMITWDYSERHLPDARTANLSRIGLELCRQTIRRGLQRANLVCFPAQWAANEAQKYCDVSEKLRVIPFGANVSDPGPEVAVNRSFSNIQESGRIDLLFVGKDWNRKGGDVAVGTVTLLQDRGVNAHLHVVGSRPDIDLPYVHIHGYLDKSFAEEREKLIELWINSDVLVLPSSSEGFVIAVLEAAAFGMPVLGYEAMGVVSAVLPDETGMLLPLGSPADRFADVVCEWFQQPSLYDGLVCGSREHFEQNVNWTVCVMRLMKVIESVLVEKALDTTGTIQSD